MTKEDPGRHHTEVLDTHCRHLPKASSGHCMAPMFSSTQHAGTRVSERHLSDKVPQCA